MNRFQNILLMWNDFHLCFKQPGQKTERFYATLRQKREIAMFGRDNPTVSHRQIMRHFSTLWGKKVRNMTDF